MSLLCSILFLALTRAEMIERMRAPIVTQSEGLIQVFSNCPEDMRREFQMPVASFASETVKGLYGGLREKPRRFRSPGIVIHIGDVRTNDNSVVVRVATNDQRIVSRIFLRSPGHADVRKLRIEVIKGFYRSVRNEELTDAEAIAAYRRANPYLRIADERQSLEDWLAGRLSNPDDEEYLRLMRKVIEPGFASVRDVITFASRLYLTPPTFDQSFIGGNKSLSFREAVALAEKDPRIRLMAALKSTDLPVFGCGRGDAMTEAVEAYVEFLRNLADDDVETDELTDLLDAADAKLNVAFEKALLRERGKTR